ncbi:SHOCT domain-containing protein [Halorubrum sp. CSM-61]|uniref:SHOCT domain-containing protein n=1 Tax=Halorubrum sp. CSM-61 TaxID=2485838 RepID=UPI000F4B1189|nr:SHOCT domain-containing protein [Halorubrum sp. CSM-61]
MADSSTRERFRRNASEIASTVVTGTWLAALFLGVEWWLPLMLFGYIVVVPVVAMLFGEDEESERIDGDPATGWEADGERERESRRETDRIADGDTADALDRLRARYAEGDLTDEQFERKLDRLLETETPEDAAEYVERGRRVESDPERDVERDR